MKLKLSCLALITATAFPLAAAAQTYSAFLSPLNNSNVSGTAILTLNGNFLTVMLNAIGLEPNQLHIQHIHGLLNNGVPVNSTIPTLAQDTDRDGFVELAEGLPTYGPVLLQLTAPPGDTVNGFPTAPNGQINYLQTFDLSQQSQFGTTFNRNQLLPLELREIVIHGLTVGAVGAGTPGEVNGIAGYKVALPVSAGEIFQNVAVSPIPEPETYALMLAGLGLMGFVGKYRKKQS